MAQNSTGQSQRIRDQHSHLALLALLIVFLSVTLVYGQLNPLGEAPDEIAHMDLIRFIGTEGHLPRTEAERQAAGYKSDSPMLYHILAGADIYGGTYRLLHKIVDRAGVSVTLADSTDPDKFSAECWRPCWP